MVILSRYLIALLAVLLLCCWGCGDPPNSVMEMVLPDKNMPPAEEPAVTMADVKTTPTEEVTAAEQPPDEPPVTMEEEQPPPPVKMGMPDLSLAMEMDAIMASEGEVHSPIPDDVYELLWGHWTKAGSAAPRRFYTRYIDAEGIAIVGSDNVEDLFFQAARHVVLVMTSKLPGLREALSADQPGGITGDEVPFRVVLTDLVSRDVVNMPENLNTNLGPTALWVGSFGGYFVQADVGYWGENPNNDIYGWKATIHEMAHAIHHAIGSRNLVPNFNERLGTSFDREMEKVQLRWDIDGNPYLPYIDADGTIVDWNDLPEWEDRPGYCMANGNSHDNASEFWAHYVEREWFHNMFDPYWRSLEPNYSPLEHDRERCPNLVGITEEVFPPFSLHYAIETKDYK